MINLSREYFLGKAGLCIFHGHIMCVTAEINLLHCLTPSSQRTRKHRNVEYAKSAQPPVHTRHTLFCDASWRKLL